MVTQYPHTVQINYSGPGTKDNATGNRGAGAATSFSFEGRLEEAGSRSRVKGLDGAWIVYTKDTRNVPVGATVTVTDAAGLQLCKEKVQFYRKGQLNSRIWV